VDIRIQGLNKFFKNFQVLKNVNLTINEGEIFGILGPNGAGKSTLVKIILGIYGTERNHVFVNNTDVCDAEYNEIKKKIGFLLDNLNLVHFFNIYKNIEFFDKIYYEDDIKENRKKRIEKLINIFKLDVSSKKRSFVLSTGQKQRIALARALINKPKLLILDEPNRGLDREGKLILNKILVKLAEEKTTIIVVSHELEDLSNIVERAVFIDNGEIIGQPWVKNENNMNLLEFYDSHLKIGEINI